MRGVRVAPDLGVPQARRTPALARAQVIEVESAAGADG